MPREKKISTRVIITSASEIREIRIFLSHLLPSFDFSFFCFYPPRQNIRTRFTIAVRLTMRPATYFRRRFAPVFQSPPSDFFPHFSHPVIFVVIWNGEVSRGGGKTDKIGERERETRDREKGQSIISPLSIRLSLSSLFPSFRFFFLSIFIFFLFFFLRAKSLGRATVTQGSNTEEPFIHRNDPRGANQTRRLTLNTQ